MGLKSVLFFGALAGMAISAYTSANQSTFPEYHFNGSVGQENVDQEKVAFGESSWIIGRSYLDVTKADGTKVRYFLRENSVGHSLALEEVMVGTGSELTRFPADSKSPDIAAVAEKAKPDVEKYLKGILELKVQQYK